MLFRHCLLFIAMVLVPTVLTAETAAPETLVRLENHLDRIRQEYKFGRELGGGVLIGLGALVGGGGAVIAQTQLTGAANTELRNGVLYGALGVGGLYAGGGLLVLVLKGDFETVPERYLAAPSDTDEQQRTKIALGEAGLQSLADKARFSRLLASGLMGVVGGAVLISGAAPNNSSAYGSTNGGYSTSSSLYTGLTYVGFAVVNFLLESTSERENRAYLNWKSGSR